MERFLCCVGSAAAVVLLKLLAVVQYAHRTGLGLWCCLLLNYWLCLDYWLLNFRLLSYWLLKFWLLSCWLFNFWLLSYWLLNLLS